MGLFWGTHFQHGGEICPPKQSHNALSQPSRPGLPRNLKVANLIAHFELLSHETLAKLNVGAMAFESISLLLPNLCLGLLYSFCLFCLDGMPAGRLEVMLSYSDTPDAPVAHAPLKKRSILKRFSSNSNL